jgi:hypothetical protein
MDDCTLRASYPSVLCRGHAKNYATWRERVDLSTIKGETSLTYWLEFGDVPTPKHPPRKGEVIVWVIGVLADTEAESATEAMVDAMDTDAPRRAVSVRVPGRLDWDKFAGTIVYGEDDDGAPHKYRAVDGWYSSHEGALEASREERDE